MRIVEFGLRNGKFIPHSTFRIQNSGQMHTLEGFGAAVLLFLVLIFAAQATSITPLTSSAANQHVEAQLQFYGQDILAAMDYKEDASTMTTLKSAIVTWNGSAYNWNGSAYVMSGNTEYKMDNLFTRTLRSALVQRSIAHNVEIGHIDNTTWNTTPRYVLKQCTSSGTGGMLCSGMPSDNAVIVSRIVVLHDEDVSSTEFYNNTGIGDLDGTTNFYNVINIRMVLWRM